jgi:hypothetical protein
VIRLLWKHSGGLDSNWELVSNNYVSTENYKSLLASYHFFLQAVTFNTLYQTIQYINTIKCEPWFTLMRQLGNSAAHHEITLLLQVR